MDRASVAAPRLAALLLLLACTMAGASSPEQTTLDDFERLEGWTTTASDGSTASISPDAGRSGTALRIDFELPKDGGWVIVRKAFDLTMPDNYAFNFQLRGQAPRENFEFKLVDPSGKNVWWRVRTDFLFPTDWQEVTIRKARIAVAWGSPATPHKVGAIEFAIRTGNAGKGSVWIDDFAFEKREPASQYRRTARVTASSYAPDHHPSLAIDAEATTAWKSVPGVESQWLLINFVRLRDYGGLAIDWDPLDYAAAYRVEVSDDARKWITAFVNTHGRGGREFAYMPDAESRYVRLVLERSSRGQGYGIASVVFQPPEFSDTPNRFFQALAGESPPGTYPKYWYGKQTYWTVVGTDAAEKNALFNEEGMLEVEPSGFSIEPFVFFDGRLTDWSGARITQALADGYLPIPSAQWDGMGFGLRVTAFAAGEPGASVLYATYRLENRRAERQRATLFLACRPFQVNPTWQSLNVPGGVAPIHEIRFDGGAVWVNRDKAVIPLRAPDAFGATSLEQGSLIDALREGKVPPQSSTWDRFGFASAAFGYVLDLDPGQAAEVSLAIPFQRPDMLTLPPRSDVADVEQRLADARRAWVTRLGHVEIDLPPQAGTISRAFRTALAHILINRDGPRLQPGARNYARSWIRDGALTSAALLGAGFTREPREFLDWFSRYQGADGKVPCCVDRRGADPVNEHDSNGQFLYAIAEIYRYTGDIGLVSELWPRVLSAVEYLERLRRRSMTEAFRSGDRRVFYGLLPASISHEGYASQPQHSYWDDFFALRGFKDAARLAVAVGDDANAARFAALRDEFRSDLHASLLRAMEQHGIDYLPGSAELGDFDPTSTAVALDPVGEGEALPRAALERTFDKYYEQFRVRRDGPGGWENFAPYELRNVGALVRLGQRGRAIEVLDWLLAHQRPREWHQWPEIVWRDPTEPRFIGDMPHTWVGSEFVRAVRSLFVYERESDQALVLAAGLPRAWVSGENRVSVRRLSTPFGTLSYSLESDGPRRLRMRLYGDLRLPPGNLVIRPPLERPLGEVRVNGHRIRYFTPWEVTVAEFPALVELDSAPPPAPTPVLRPGPAR